MKVAVLIANGANNLEIPCMIFPTMEEGRKFCSETFKVEPTGKKTLRYDVSLEVSISDEPDTFDENDESTWGDDEDENPLAHKLFTKYYGSCGDAYFFTLKEVECGKPFVQWDLD